MTPDLIVALAPVTLAALLAALRIVLAFRLARSRRVTPTA
jgi:hypothetical protein